MRFTFHPLKKNDLPLLYQWLQEPHVACWIKESKDWSEFAKKYKKKIIDNKDIWPYFAYFNTIPVAYIQYYDATKDPHPYLKDCPEKTYGMDVWVGDPEYIGKGYGTQLIKQFINEIIMPNKPQKIIIDPAIDNTRAIHVYEKIGFKKIKEIETTDGTKMVKAVLMELDPKEYNLGVKI